ncbi:MAG: hypothetical protein JW940_02355 [Polyangiaceae bacterium]|nr:hypothetical protein [Polyangiaceae bacterium]
MNLTPQAWSFKLGEAADKFSTELTMPESLVDGQEQELRVLSSHNAGLIVFREERDGAITLLLPNADCPRAKTPANRWTAPRLRASLRDPRAPAQERLIVSAVDDE